jgi:hypothetical protein
MSVPVFVVGSVGGFSVVACVCGLCGGSGSLGLGLWGLLFQVVVWWDVVHWVGLELVLLGGRVPVRVVQLQLL